MTTTNTYNPIFRAFNELTTPEAFRWYGTQAKTTAILAQAIAHYSFTAAQRLLSDRHRLALAPAVAEPENAQTIAPVVQDDGAAVAGLENAKSLCVTALQELAIAPQQEYASTEAETIALAIEPELDFGDAITGDGDAALSWADEVPLDDDTELRPWAGDDAEVVESPVLSYQWEEDAEALAGDEA
jgi:hypothetical protein